MIKQAIELLPVQIDDKQKLFNNIKEFIEQRLIVFLSDKYKHDVLEACVSEKDVLADLQDFIIRLNIVTDIVQKPSYSQFHEAINRIIRLIKNEKDFSDVNTDLLKNNAEQDLWSTVKNIDENNLSYKMLESQLVKLIPYITVFFDKVLVMDNDEKIKQNRFNLLHLTKQKFAKIADFSKIVF